ncbi:MAG: ATP-binding protein, partial [Cyclobacteriaceae bacterium]
RRFKGDLYVAVSNGLFIMDTLNRLNRLPKFVGTCYFLFTINIEGKERLLISDDEGLKEWTGEKLITILQGPGEGFIVYQTRKKPNRILLASSVRALSMIYENGKWKKECDIPQTTIESLAEAPDGSIWMNIREGIAKIDTDKIPFHTTTYSLPENLNQELSGGMFTSPQGDILLGTSKGIYTFDIKSNKIIPWTGFGQEMTDRLDKVLYTTQLNDSTYFMTSNKPSSSLICTITKKGTIIHDAPFKRLPDNGKTNCVWSDADGTIWLGGSYGLIHYNSKWDTKEYQQSFNCLIQKVSVARDSTILNGSLSFLKTEKPKPVLGYENNQIQFEFAAPFFDKEEETLYSYRLQGLTDTWSEWGKVYYKEYSNLFEDTYTFQVKAKNIYGIESSIASYSFTILPPWYRTWWAYGLYLFLTILAITVLIRQRTHYINERRKELEKIVEQQTGELKASNEELKASNESLIVTQRKLIASEKMASLGQLTAGIAHEINNPINFISGGVQALRELQHEVQNRGHQLTKEEREDKNREIEDLMTSIINGVHRTSDIIKSLRQFSSPNDEFNDSVYADVSECISDSLLIINSKLKEANIEVQTHIQVQTHAQAIGSQVSQVLMNLIDNSIDALLQRSNNRLIRIIAEETSREIVIRVIDNGAGIPAEKQSHIFEPFFTTKSVGKGIGLGLFICYSLIQKHGGSLSFESNSNGTTFTVTLPKKMNSTH